MAVWFFVGLLVLMELLGAAFILPAMPEKKRLFLTWGMGLWIAVLITLAAVFHDQLDPILAPILAPVLRWPI